jgi:hypothetical protein
VDRRRTLPLVPFAFVSLGLHAATFRAIERSARAPGLAFEPPPAAQTISGDTLEVESAPIAPGDTDETSDHPAPDSWPPTLGARAAAPASGGAPSMPAATSGHATIFGAVGVRFATDLATTFTRAFAQAASADPAWETSAFGAAGSADVTLVLDDEGHLSASAIAGGPSVALRRGIERTVALIGPRTFTAREAVTKIRVSARVTRDEIHDGLHGDVFALSGGSFSGDLGAAFFALPPAAGPGRRVDVELRLVR